MTHNAHAPEESHRLEALIRHRVGWQVDDLQVLVGEHGLILEGHARCGCARRMAQDEADRLSGLPVENRIAVT